jgi:hypothetical protein
MFNRWWEAFCEKKGLDWRDPFYELFGYHVLELVKNGRSVGTVVGVRVYARSSGAEAVVQDDGPGLSNELTEIHFSKGSGHGLLAAINFANRFVLETHGLTYVKRNGVLNLKGPSEICEGVKISIYARR